MSSSQVDPAKLQEFSQQNEEKLNHVLQIMNSDEWKLSKEEPEITFYTRSEKDSSFTQVKSVVTIETPLATVLDVMRRVDPINEKEGKGGLTERTVLYGPEDNENETMIFYISQNIPAPLVSPRDYLLFRRHYSRDGKEIYVHHSISCDEVKAPVSGKVRANMIFQAFIAEAIDENTSKMTFLAHCDPCGSMPAFAFNMAVTKQGYAARGMRNMALEKAKQ